MNGGGQRINAWLLVPAVLLALGVGTLLGRAVQDDDPAVASGPETEVLGSQVTKSDDTEPATTTTTTEPAVTTTTAAPAAPTAAAKVATTTTVAPSPRPAAAAVPATTSTTSAVRRTAANGCGDGAAGAKGNFTVTGDGPPSDPFFTYSGPVTVTNGTTKAIEVDALEVRMTSADGTVETAQVPGARGAIIEAGATTEFPFSYTSKHVPKEGGAQMGTFSYRAPGGRALCGTT